MPFVLLGAERLAVIYISWCLAWLQSAASYPKDFGTRRQVCHGVAVPAALAVGACCHDQPQHGRAPCCSKHTESGI